jgi:hypothetical protein
MLSKEWAVVSSYVDRLDLEPHREQVTSQCSSILQMTWEEVPAGANQSLLFLTLLLSVFHRKFRSQI